MLRTGCGFMMVIICFHCCIFLKNDTVVHLRIH